MKYSSDIIQVFDKLDSACNFEGDHPIFLNPRKINRLCNRLIDEEGGREGGRGAQSE